MSSKPFASVKVGTTPAEVVRRYIEAFKTHDILTLAALNNQDALYRIARIRETYPQVLWKDELRKWAEVYVSNLVRGFEATPKMVGGWGSLLGDWDPGFLVVESLTYEVLEAKPGLDVTLVFVRVTYPPGSLRRGPNPIKQAVIEIRVLKHDERRVAAQLKNQFFVSRRLGDAFADFHMRAVEGRVGCT